MTGSITPVSVAARSDVLSIWDFIAALFVLGGLVLLAEASRDVVQPLPSGERKLLVHGGTDGRVVPSGHLVYQTAGTIWAMPFDPGKLKALYSERWMFVRKFSDAADALVRQGYWLEPEAAAAKADAARARLGR